MVAATATREMTSRKKAESPSTESESRANGKRSGSGCGSARPGSPRRTQSENPMPSSARAVARGPPERSSDGNGLARGIAELVLVVGHGSTSLDDPHESAHEC